MARGSGYTVSLTATEAALLVGRGDSSAQVRMSLLGSDPHASGQPLQKLPGKVNFLVGDDPSRWRTGIPTYGRVSWSGVYPGVDVVYYGNEANLEYDFIVAPGADPGRIRLSYAGATDLHLNDDGALVLDVGHGQLVQHPPVVYQEGRGGRQAVGARYRLEAKEVAFIIDAYDRNRPLVIDPVLSYSTYLGGTSSEEGNAIAVDGSGSSYVVGSTLSADFPRVNRFQAAHGGADRDVFVSKLNPSGTGLVYSYYLGGSGNDQGRGIAVDSAGNTYITGIAGSSNFPLVTPFQASKTGPDLFDAFVTKVNAAGSALAYSTFLGGGGPDEGARIAVDASGSAYVVGTTLSSTFPTSNARQGSGGGSFDAFVTKFTPAGTSLAWSTYHGGNGEDRGHDIALDSSGNAYVAGQTVSTNFPTVSPLQAMNRGFADAFVSKFTTAGSLTYSTYLGGSEGDPEDCGSCGDDIAFGVAVDATGNAYVTGYTQSGDFPLVDPIQMRRSLRDAFVSRLNAAGSALDYSTYWERAARATWASTSPLTRRGTPTSPG